LTPRREKREKKREVEKKKISPKRFFTPLSFSPLFARSMWALSYILCFSAPLFNTHAPVICTPNGVKRKFPPTPPRIFPRYLLGPIPNLWDREGFSKDTMPKENWKTNILINYRNKAGKEN